VKKSDIAEAVRASTESLFAIGEAIFIRMVSHSLTGRVVGTVAEGEHRFVILDEVAWIAVTARWHETFASGKLDEVEPTEGLTRVNIGLIGEIYPWNHPLPRKPQ
jgi:hypothetical protein